MRRCCLIACEEVRSQEPLCVVVAATKSSLEESCLVAALKKVFRVFLLSFRCDSGSVDTWRRDFLFIVQRGAKVVKRLVQTGRTDTAGPTPARLQENRYTEGVIEEIGFIHCGFASRSN